MAMIEGEGLTRRSFSVATTPVFSDFSMSAICAGGNFSFTALSILATCVMTSLASILAVVLEW